MLKKIMLISLLLVSLLLVGCPVNRGDFKFFIVHKGTEAPHDGFFVSQSWYLYSGEPVPDDGYIIWVRGVAVPEEDVNRMGR